MYSKIINGKRYVTSDGQGIRVPMEFDHPEFNHRAGELVSNPRLALLIADGWEEWTPPTPEPTPQTEPSEYDKVTALNKMLATEIVALDDNAAVAVKALFTPWVEWLRRQEEKKRTEPDVIIPLGERVYYDDELWKCTGPHTPQSTWNPRDAHSLFVMISIEDGSKEHPIKFSQGMVLEVGKYYEQYDVEYECIRSSEGQGFYADLAGVVGNYVTVAQLDI